MVGWKGVTGLRGEAYWRMLGASHCVSVTRREKGCFLDEWEGSREETDGSREEREGREREGRLLGDFVGLAETRFDRHEVSGRRLEVLGYRERGVTRVTWDGVAEVVAGNGAREEVRDVDNEAAAYVVVDDDNGG